MILMSLTVLICLLLVRVDSPLTRVQRVTAALHGHHNACGTHFSQNSYSVHGACGVWNSENSQGRHRRWGTTLLCTWGNKVIEYVYSDWGQASAAVEKPFHDVGDDTEDFLVKMGDSRKPLEYVGQNQGLKISREVEIVPGCAVRVACPSCPDYYPEPPGPGRIIRNMLGWSRLEKTERSGVWLFRVPSKERIFFSP